MKLNIDISIKKKNSLYSNYIKQTYVAEDKTPDVDLLNHLLEDRC